MQGPEAFIDALQQGALVVVAGRSSDTSIFAAIPTMRGIPEGVAFHAAKILECGAAATVERKYPDSMVAVMDADGFTVEPPNPEMVCTPQSVASHTLYENADPFRLVEPNGTLDTTNSSYTAVSDRAVRVTGSAFDPTDDYTVKLEAATLLGYRTVVLAGVRDPLVVGQIDQFVEKTQAVIREKVADSLGLTDADYQMRWEHLRQERDAWPVRDGEPRRRARSGASHRHRGEGPGHGPVHRFRGLAHGTASADTRVQRTGEPSRLPGLAPCDRRGPGLRILGQPRDARPEAERRVHAYHRKAIGTANNAATARAGPANPEQRAGPFELTLDVMFNDKESYDRVVSSHVISAERIARLYHVDPSAVRLFQADVALAIKISLPRPIPSGSLRDTDIFGGQFHSPIVRLEIP